MCVCLNGATGPRLDNEPRPFAVTPPHQRDREGRRKGRNKKVGSGKEKERRKEGRRRGREIKNGGEGRKKRDMRQRKYEGGKRQERSERKRAQSVAEEAERWEGCSFKKDGLTKKGFG